jgi:hypothetical protein
VTAVPRLRPVPVPPACQLNAPADKVQHSADAGRLPWRLDPAQVVRDCLHRDLGVAAWTISRTDRTRFTVTEPRTTLTARLRLTQPARSGTGGIWAVAGIDSNAELHLPPACAEPDPARLQAAFDQGHQPWRGNPVMVAESCTAAAYGWRHPHGRTLSPNHVLVIDDATGQTAEITGQRWRNGDIWLVTTAEPGIGQD